MQLIHNDTVLATLGELMNEAQIRHFLSMNEIDVPFEALTFRFEHEEALEYRRLSYLRESDPLYMEWQFDQTEAAKQAWLDKVAEIKARFPLPQTPVSED
ncbi:hypothetical protein [Pseudoalteromonas rubra]|uniref:Uncharacterized protein n=1 Tax=Pseudoalteromonas rubra TaxID=43658 RepID=A0A0F4QJV1_9GAMM|nr:hypothetical protein [Pseudoalteromonas rubra]KJZ07973.1 hypothetical protein TW77_14065 [Pseudoalteromonas rubra]